MVETDQSDQAGKPLIRRTNHLPRYALTAVVKRPHTISFVIGTAAR